MIRFRNREHARHVPVLFLHGQEHTFRLAADIERATLEITGLKSRIFKSMGQLLLYRQSKEIVAEISELLRENDP